MKELRELGFMESRMHLMHNHLQGTTQVCIAINVEGTIDKKLFKNAVFNVSTKVPVLQTIILETKDKLSFTHTKDINFALYFKKMESGDQWQTIFNHENNTFLNPSTSLWRFSLYEVENDINDNYLFLTLHHAIVDANGIDLLIKLIFSEYQNQFKIKTKETINNYSGLLNRTEFPLFDSAEHSLPDIFVQSWDTYLSSKLKPKDSSNKSLREFAEFVPLENRITKTTCIDINESTLQTIELFCQKINTSLNSLLSSYIMKVFSSVLTSEDGLSFHTAFSLRRLCRIPGDNIGCYISVIPLEFTKTETDMKSSELARIHHKRLSESIMMIESPPKNIDVDSLRNNIKNLATSNNFLCDIGMTFGEFSFLKNYSNLKIKSIFPTVNRAAGNASIFVHGLRYDNKLSITISHTSPNLEDQCAQEIIDNFKQLIFSHNIKNNQPNQVIANEEIEELI